jgi:hypothetical protein
MRAGEFVSRHAQVHLGVVEDEVLDMDELAFDPERGDGVVEMRALDPAVAHRRMGQALVETGQKLGRCRFHFPISIAKWSYAV